MYKHIHYCIYSAIFSDTTECDRIYIYIYVIVIRLAKGFGPKPGPGRFADAPLQIASQNVIEYATLYHAARANCTPRLLCIFAGYRESTTVLLSNPTTTPPAVRSPFNLIRYVTTTAKHLLAIAFGPPFSPPASSPACLCLQHIN